MCLTHLRAVIGEKDDSANKKVRLTPYSRILFVKLVVAQLVKKFLVFCETRRFVTIFTRARNCSVLCSESVHPFHSLRSCVLVLVVTLVLYTKISYKVDTCSFRSISYLFLCFLMLGLVKVELFRYRHAGDKGERNYSSYTFLTSARDGDEWSASLPSRALFLGRDPRYPLIGGWVGLISGKDT
jgi:hypothetical protein